MNEIWHTTGIPNHATLVIVIDKDDKIVDFGFTTLKLLRQVIDGHI